NTSMMSSSKNLNYDNEFNFNFNYSCPIALTPQFIEKFKNTPIIVEVWKKVIHLNGKQKIIPKDENELLIENKEMVDEKENSNNFETKLMGLLRIPFQYIISSFIANKETIATGNNDFGLKTPIVLPEAEYPIMDPFTGISKGWVKSTLALGPWDQINKISNIDGPKCLLEDANDQEKDKKDISIKKEEKVEKEKNIEKSKKKENN
ncbi:hypothetical protein BCR36DRAFT_270301, partial [Piromyces finnis]